MRTRNLDGQKNTQILVSKRMRGLAFGNDFQVDTDFAGDTPVGAQLARLEKRRSVERDVPRCGQVSGNQATMPESILVWPSSGVIAKWVRLLSDVGVRSSKDSTGPGTEAESMTEARLLVGLRAGDESAFMELVERYDSKLRCVARMHVSTSAAADEVVQETWLGVLKGIQRFEGRSSLKTWIFRILINSAIRRRQRDGRLVPFSALAKDEAEATELAVDPGRFFEPENPSQGHWAVPPTSWGNDPERRLLSQECMGQLQQAISELPPAQKSVVTLRDVSGWTADEVCELMEISEANQRVLLHRGRSRIRSAMESYLQVN